MEMSSVLPLTQGNVIMYKLVPLKLAVAAPMKSGGSFLTQFLSLYTGMGTTHLSDDFKGSDHSLSKTRIEKHKDESYITHLHLRASYSTVSLLTESYIRPITMSRNIFDTAVSLHDHLKAVEWEKFGTATSPLPFVYVDRDFMTKCSEQEFYEFFHTQCLSWYASYYCSWHPLGVPNVVYEELNKNPLDTLETLLYILRIEVDKLKIKKVLEHIENNLKKDIKYNKGIVGRGSRIDSRIRMKISYDLKRYYPSMDWSNVL